LEIHWTHKIALHKTVRREFTPSHPVKFAHKSFQIIDIRLGVAPYGCNS
jgi:hypothetical protein